MDYAAFLQAAERGQPPAVALLHGADEQLLGRRARPRDARAVRRPHRGARWDARCWRARRSRWKRSRARRRPCRSMTRRRLVIVRRAPLAARARPRGAGTVRARSQSHHLPAARGRRRPARRPGRVDHWLLGALPPAAIVGLPVRRGRGVEDWLKQRAAAGGPHASRTMRRGCSCSGSATTAPGCSARRARPRCSAGADNRRVGVQRGERDRRRAAGERGLRRLSRAVERRDLAQALRMLDQLLATEDAMPLLALLTAQRAHRRHRAGAGRPRPVERADRALGPAGAGAGHRGHDGPRRGGERSRRLLAAARAMLAGRSGGCKSGGEPRAELTALVADLCAAR